MDIGGVAVRLRVNPRAKRIILRIDARTREPMAVAPSTRLLGDAAAFAKRRAEWFKTRLARPPEPRPASSLDDQSVRDLRRQAARGFADRLAVHCATLGVPRPRLSITDTRSRWGSCSQATATRPPWIRLSWRLVLAPEAVADYVVAHECAHLLEANHGPRFWALVRKLVGDPRPHRAWLRANGASLHTM